MRFVRLKETPPGIERFHTPSEKYKKTCDHTLQPGPFVQRGTPDGFLDTGNDRPNASKNLVMIGGSFVESMFSEETTRFTSQIERTLPEDWRVLNGGYSGMTTLHILPLLAAKVVPYVVPNGKLLLFIGQSDFNVLNDPSSYWSARPSSVPIKPTWPSHIVPWNAREALYRVTDAVLSTADSLGLDYGVVASPFREGDFNVDRVLRRAYLRDRARYTQGIELRRLIQQSARELTERRGKPFFDSQSQTNHAGLFYDTVHLNARGQDAYSETLGSWIRNSFLINR